MLVGLTVRNVVLVEQLSIGFAPGLCALTGETGAGKSILLDALGLALGSRADSSLVRHGAEAATVTAEFDVDEAHPAHALLREHDLSADGTLLLRRTVSRDGRSRAYANDQAVSANLLRRLGAQLVEIHGQFETQGLLNPATHRSILDAHGNLAALVARAATAWRAWRDAETERADAAEAAERARAEEDFLRHAVTELDELDPKPGEESALAETRVVLMNREKLIDAASAAEQALDGDHGATQALGGAQRALLRIADKAGGRLDGVLETLDRALAEAGEAIAQLQSVATDMDLDAAELERLEERLFTLRAVARKHGVGVDDLAALRSDLAGRLALIEDQGDRLNRLAAAASAARAGYVEAAQTLSEGRQAAATALDAAVATELPPLKLDKARFRTEVTALPEPDWGPTGMDQVAFVVATNPGAPFGPLNKIASGGELARFMLALKVVLARSSAVPTLVFDEVDSGISGAVADAVGERLSSLARLVQVLVVTHSPQVAARAVHHWRVQKDEVLEQVLTTVVELPDEARREEIARMLSGARVTDQARAAADSLIAARTA